MRKLDYDKEKNENGERVFRSLPENYSGIYVIPEGITTIAKGAFKGCSYLTSIEIPSSVTSIGDSAFSGCSGLTSIEIPSGVTSIGDYAFYGCSGLTSIEIPSGVTNIGRYAFLRCMGLTAITIPDSVVYIGERVVDLCPKLDKKVVDKINSLFLHTKERELDVSPTNAPDEKSKETEEIEIAVNENDVSWRTGTEIVIPEGITQIKRGEFEHRRDIISIQIPSSVTSIGNGAFSGCSGLTSIEIPSGVTSIGYRAFDGCSGLTSIEIPSGVTSIGNCAFDGCSGLTSIVIPSSVTSIGSDAFSGCSHLSKVRLLGSFMSIRWPVFSGCTELKKISFERQKNNQYPIENGVVYNRARTEVLEYIGSMSDGNISIDRKVRIIRSRAFSDMSSIKTIELPEYLKTIEGSAFDLKSSKFTITVKFQSPDSIDINNTYSVMNISKNCTLIVPECSGYAYRHHPVWGQFTVKVTSDDDDAEELTSEENL